MKQLTLLGTSLLALCAFSTPAFAQAKQVEKAQKTQAKTAVKPLWQFKIKGISG